MAVLAELENISLRFGTRWILQHLSMQVPTGAVVLITGENGAGKTTLLRLLATALRPTRGSLRLFGHPAQDFLPQVRARLALMTHHSFLYDNLSARENLAFVAKLLGVGPQQLDGLLERSGILSRQHQQVSTFSAGMKRRLMLARLGLQLPELVLLDEPFGQLDPEGVQLMEEAMGNWRQRGTTLVLSTHDIERGQRLCTHRMHLGTTGAKPMLVASP